MRFSICITALLALSAQAAVAQDLADGRYGCTISSYFLGEIEIAGGLYRGPAFDGKFGPDYPFDLVGGTINWGGPLGGISDAGTIVSTVLGKTYGDRIGFDVTIQNDRGNFQTITCTPV